MREAIQILLAEDNAGDVRLLSRAMKNFPVPCKVHVVQQGEEALAFLNREGPFVDAPPINLILLDWNLPRIHGRDVLMAIKSASHLKHIPVVILTTSDAPADVLQAYTLYANCYITKPLELQAYLQLIEELERFWLTCAKLPAVPA